MIEDENKVGVVVEDIHGSPLFDPHLSSDDFHIHTSYEQPQNPFLSRSWT